MLQLFDKKVEKIDKFLTVRTAYLVYFSLNSALLPIQIDCFQNQHFHDAETVKERDVQIEPLFFKYCN